VSQELQAIETERRANAARHSDSERLLKLLVAAQNDPRQLLATPNSLLESQPSVSQLKNALVSAQVQTAELLGSRSENHPFVIASREAENLIRVQLNDEVAVAIRGLQVEIELCVDREASLAAKFAAARERMSRLAGARAEYANLASSVQNHTRLVEAARKNLADARARLAGAHSASVISRIDGVEAGVRPAGPARRTVAAAGGVGGMLLGFGLIFLFGNLSPVAAQAPSAATHVLGKVEAVTKSSDAPVSVSEPGSPPIVDRPRTINESFGMFRGMSLQDTVRAVERRIK
jgi:uncharacterized protein involved in exopolysaccharide biosynthesis